MLSSAVINSIKVFILIFLQMGLTPVDAYLIPKDITLTQTTLPHIPRIIWTYWDGPITDPFLLNCIKGWKRYNPNYSVRVVQKTNMKVFITESEFPENFESLKPAFQADWVRVALLKEHGGIWLDASYIVTGSLDFIIKKQQRSGNEAVMFFFEGYNTVPDFPVIENWFIASVPHGEFVSAWFKEFDYITKKYGNDGQGYLDELRDRYGPERYALLEQNIGTPDYLKMQVAAQKIMQIDGVMQPYSENSFIKPYGPFMLLGMAKTDREKLADILLEEWTSGPVPVLTKLTGMCRSAIKKQLDKGRVPHPKSIFSRFILANEEGVVDRISRKSLHRPVQRSLSLDHHLNRFKKQRVY